MAEVIEASSAPRHEESPGRAARDNPFPGPQPYRPDQAELFFGRRREVNELTALIRSSSLVLLHARSGAGKSSLLQAGVVPALRTQGLVVAPPVRFGRMTVSAGGGDLARRPNPFAAMTVDSLMVMGPTGDATDVSAAVGALSERRGRGLVLVLDQFEEILVNPLLWREAGTFLTDLHAALDRHRWFHVLLSIRSDHPASLQSYERELPWGSVIRYALESLDEPRARRVVEHAFATTDVPIAPAEVDLVLDRLLDLGPGPLGPEHVRGRFVDLLTMQILCRRLWDERAGVATAGASVPQEGGAHDVVIDLGEVMTSFVDTAIAAVVHRTGADEGVVRGWLMDRLSTSDRRRAVLPVSAGSEDVGLPSAVVTALEEERVIRLEQRGDSGPAELTHDRMADAVLNSNGRWAPARSARRRRRTGRLAGVLMALLLFEGTWS